MVVEGNDLLPLNHLSRLSPSLFLLPISKLESAPTESAKVEAGKEVYGTQK